MSTATGLKRLPRIFREGVKKLFFYRRYGFLPPPSWSDMSGYETLLDAILQHKIYQLAGDFVEIGAFLGGGTYKLSRLLRKLGLDKKIYAIDIFNPDFDKSMCTQRLTMSELYMRTLRGLNQYEVYKKITKGFDNVVTIMGDSMKITLPCQKICFAYIDGNHNPDYIRNDFYIIWDKLVSGGVVAFDDYGYDLPQVTETIHGLIGENRGKIEKIWTSGLKTIFIQKYNGA